MVYLQRVIERHPHIEVSLRTIHRLVISAVVVSAKFNDDSHQSNATYAQIGGICIKELNRLEVYFLKLSKFMLYISEADYYRAVLAFTTANTMLSMPAPLPKPPALSNNNLKGHFEIKSTAGHSMVVPAFQQVATVDIATNGTSLVA